MITDDTLRDLFERRADDVQTTHEIPGALLKRVRRRQRLVAVAATTAVGILVVGAWLGGTLLTRSAELQRERENATIGLLPPTRDRLAGIWARVQGPDFQPAQLLVRFGSDGKFVFDDSGEFDFFPGILGTYDVNGDTITFKTGPKITACPHDSWAFRASLSQDGRLDIEVIEEGTSRCRVRVGTEWTFARISPRSAAGALIVADEPTGEAVPPSTLHLAGIWFRDDGQLLSLRGDMSYVTDDGGELDTNPDEQGQYRLSGRTLTFTSGAGSTTCQEGAVRVWKRLRLDGWTLRGVVSKDECLDAVGAEQTWIVVSGGTYPRDND
jgi:hypothetical protein